jgi:hypothetical protein
MDLVLQYWVSGSIAIAAAVFVLLLVWFAYRRPQIYRRIFIWVILLPQAGAVSLGIWNEALRQSRAIVASRAKAPDCDAIMQAIDGKITAEWLGLTIAFACTCLALMLYFLPDTLKNGDKR